MACTKWSVNLLADLVVLARATNNPSLFPTRPSLVLFLLLSLSLFSSSEEGDFFSPLPSFVPTLDGRPSAKRLSLCRCRRRLYVHFLCIRGSSCASYKTRLCATGTTSSFFCPLRAPANGRKSSHRRLASKYIRLRLHT